MPPKGILRICERYYRPAMGLFCIALTALMRYGIAGGWLFLLTAFDRIRTWVTKQKRQ